MQIIYVRIRTGDFYPAVRSPVESFLFLPLHILVWNKVTQRQKLLNKSYLLGGAHLNHSSQTSSQIFPPLMIIHPVRGDYND